MSRLSIATPGRAQTVVESLYRDVEHRISASPPGLCPVDMALSFLRLCHAQTCGKCVPCRIGLGQLTTLLESVLDSTASRDTIDLIEKTARVIQDTADCAIGYEAARMVLQGVQGFREDYISHVEHGRCLFGLNQPVPCVALCPAGVDIPGYIALVRAGRYNDAVRLIRKDNPFPTVCGYVCEHPCEARCRRALIDAPVNIRGIKRYAVDAASADTVAPPPRSVDTARTVAVIGGGPSGLTCAYFCALMGHRVTVFEARERLGGMMRYGIPAYRFPRERLDEDIRGIMQAGTITVRCGVEVDAETLSDIAGTFHAVYVAVGAQAGKGLSLPGAQAEGVLSAVDLLGAVGDGAQPDFSGKRVVVVGGGNVAMDCARTAVRAGAEEVSVVYRRRREDMTALAAEVESAVAEGVELITLEAPERIECDGKGHCAALVTRPQMIGPVKRGRPAPVAADKPERLIPADIVLVAVGQDVVTAPFEEFGMKADRGRLVADEHLRAAGFEHIFVGGDCQTGPATVIRAIAAGKVAARNIDEHLGFHHKLAYEVEVPSALPNDRTPMGRVELGERPARERKRDFLNVETGMSREEVAQECGRCLRCDRFGCGVLEGGREQYA